MALLFRIACAWVLAFGWARAGEGVSPDGHLDTAAVRDAYLRADMAFVRGALEGYIKTHPKDVSMGEKLFTHLYLGAAYSGEPGARARAEAHFRAAIRFAPDADPANLYLAPPIKAWFESLRAEARTDGREASPRIDGHAGSSPSGISRPAPPADATASGTANRDAPAAEGASRPVRNAGPADGRSWLWWTLGGTAAAAAVGAGTLGWILAESRPEPRRVHVDATLK